VKEDSLACGFDFGSLPCFLSRTLHHNLIVVLKTHVTICEYFEGRACADNGVMAAASSDPSITWGWVLDTKRDKYYITFSPLHTSCSPIFFFLSSVLHSLPAWNFELR
jgi:hypothetical protein